MRAYRPQVFNREAVVSKGRAFGLHRNERIPTQSRFLWFFVFGKACLKKSPDGTFFDSLKRARR
jgi:hypothetical protein